MIPRLLPANTTNFNTAGISLTDAISCKVTEERNGVFTLEMVVATTTPYFDQIKEGMLIVAKPNHTQGLQAFEICKVTRPILQRVTIYANHISYKQSFIPVEPFSCTGITATLQGLVSHSLETNPFTFTTTITNTTSTYNQIAPASLRSRLGGTEGSVLDVFGGEYLWDNYTTRLLLHRGQDNGVELRVGKNITDLEQSTELDNVITGVLPYWTDSEETQHFYGDIQYNSDVNNYAYHRTVVLDLSDQFETAPSVSQLNAAGHEYVTQANLGIPSTSIRVSYVDLADTDEYKGSVLERTNLCDTVKVIYTPLNISYQAKVIKLVFDVLAERTAEVEIGDARSTISKTITDLVGDVSSVVKTGKKLVSVTQKIDREVGSISQTVADVQETVEDVQGDVGTLQGNVSTLQGDVGDLQGDVGELGDSLDGVNTQITTINTNVSNIQQTAQSIQTQVTQTQTILENDYATKEQLSSSVSSLSSTIQQTASDITITISDVQSTVNSQGSQITTLETYIGATSRGLEIGRNTDDVKAVLGNNELAFYDKGNTKLAWLNSDEGLGATGLSIGNATTANQRWRVFTRQNGSHLTFTRHS